MGNQCRNSYWYQDTCTTLAEVLLGAAGSGTKLAQGVQSRLRLPARVAQPCQSASTDPSASLRVENRSRQSK